MSRVPDFYSVNEAKKPADRRRYHDKDTCPAGRAIPKKEQLPGTNSYKHCEDCAKVS